MMLSVAHASDATVAKPYDANERMPSTMRLVVRETKPRVAPPVHEVRVELYGFERESRNKRKGKIDGRVNSHTLCVKLDDNSSENVSIENLMILKGSTVIKKDGKAVTPTAFVKRGVHYGSLVRMRGGKIV